MRRNINLSLISGRRHCKFGIFAVGAGDGRNWIFKFSARLSSNLQMDFTILFISVLGK